MSVAAAGAYLRTLREHHRLTRAEVAELTGTSETQIVRIEGGDVDSRGTLWAKFVAYVHGNFEQLANLLLDASATEEDGRRFAEEWLTRAQRATIDQLYQTYGDERVRAAVTSLQALSSDELLRVISEASEIVRGRASEMRAASPPSFRRRRGWPGRPSPSTSPDDGSAVP